MREGVGKNHIAVYKGCYNEAHACIQGRGAEDFAHPIRNFNNISQRNVCSFQHKIKRLHE